MSLNPAHSNVMRKYQKEKQLDSSRITRNVLQTARARKADLCSKSNRD